MKLPRDTQGAMSFDPTVEAVAGVPTILTDSAYRFRGFSDDYCAVLQRSREELMQIEWHTILHPDDIADPVNRQAMLLANGEPYDTVVRLRRGDGQWLRGHFRSALLERGFRRDPMIQTSAWFESIPEPEPADRVLPPLVTESDLVEYIQTIATELAKAAGSRRLTVLHHLLSMVSLEAADEIQRRCAPAGTFDFASEVN